MPLPKSSGEQLGLFQLSILALSVVALAIVAADTFFTLPTEVSRFIQGVDFVICLVFFVDFVLRFKAAECKRDFMRFGWIDLLASVPALDLFRLGRMMRVLRILRLLRGVRSLHRLLRIAFRNKVKGGITSVVLTMFLLVVFSSVAVLVCEQDPESNITTAGDALWWSITTVTTVGYGDRYPVTFEGRVLAMTLMLAGVGLFGALSGIIASVFLGQSEEDSELAEEIRALRSEMTELRRLKSETLIVSPSPIGNVRAVS